MSLFLVDGHALAYRSYYAFIRKPLVNSRGEETSAVFGFVKTILGLLDRYQPTHFAVVFDSREAMDQGVGASGLREVAPNPVS